MIRDLKTGKIFRTFYLNFELIETKKKVGDIIEGIPGIWLGSGAKKSREKLLFRQPHNSPYIEVVVEITKKVDAFSFYAFSSIQEKEILIEMEDKFSFEKGDRVYMEGEIKIELKEFLDENELKN